MVDQLCRDKLDAVVDYIEELKKKVDPSDGVATDIIEKDLWVSVYKSVIHGQSLHNINTGIQTYEAKQEADKALKDYIMVFPQMTTDEYKSVRKFWYERASK